VLHDGRGHAPTLVGREVRVIAALLLAGHLSDLYGRRRLLLPAVGISIVSAGVFLASKSLPG
jgi:MFS family permease